MPVFTILFIVIATVMTVFAVLALMGWHVFEKNYPKPEILPKDRRRDEEAALTTQQKKLYLQAQKLISEKNIKDAAKILESIGMVRKSVTILEKNGYIDVAAEILLRINRPHRAGVIYARSGKWEQAMHCFKIAKMPIEVAKCLFTMGRFLEAGRLFEKNGDYVNAAQAYRRIQHVRDLARCSYFGGNIPLAYEQLKEFLRENLHLTDYNLTRLELQLLEEYIQKGEHTPEVIHALAKENYLGDVIYGLLKNKQLDGASSLYKYADSKAIASIIGQISVGHADGEGIIELFKLNKDKLSLAMAYEKLGQYDTAGKTYEEVNDLIQALSCYSQAGDERSVQRVSLMIAERKSNINETKPEGSNVLPIESQLGVSSSIGTQTKRQVLEECALFNRLSPEQKRRFWIAGSTSTYKEGQEILSESAVPRGIYILLNGFATSEHKGEEPALQGEGECFGVQDILLNQSVRRRIVAKTNCVVHFIETDELRNLMDKDGRLTRVLFQNAIKLAGRKPSLEPEESTDTKKLSVAS